MLPNWQLTNHGPLCEKPLTSPWIWQKTKPLLSRVFFHFPSILTKQCWVLWFFLKPVSNFDNLPYMKFSIWMDTTLSMIFDTWGKNTDRPIVFFVQVIIFLINWGNFFCFQFVWKTSISDGWVIIFVRRETWTSIVDFNISEGISGTGVALELSSFEIYFRISSSVV